MAVYTEEDLGGKKNPNRPSKTEQKNHWTWHPLKICYPRTLNTMLSSRNSQTMEGKGEFTTHRTEQAEVSRRIRDIPHKERGRAQSWLAVQAAAHSDTAELPWQMLLRLTFSVHMFVHNEMRGRHWFIVVLTIAPVISSSFRGGLNLLSSLSLPGYPSGLHFL